MKIFGLVLLLAVTTEAMPNYYANGPNGRNLNGNKRQCLENVFGVKDPLSTEGVEEIKRSLFFEILFKNVNDNDVRLITDFEKDVKDFMVKTLEKDEKCATVETLYVCRNPSCQPQNLDTDQQVTKKVWEWIMEQDILDGAKLLDVIVEFLDPAVRSGVLELSGQEVEKSSIKWTKNGLDALEKSAVKTSMEWVLPKYVAHKALPFNGFPL